MRLGVPKDQEGSCSHRICLVQTAECDRKRPGSAGVIHPTWSLINQLLKGISAQAFINLAHQYAFYNV